MVVVIPTLIQKQREAVEVNPNGSHINVTCHGFSIYNDY